MFSSVQSGRGLITAYCINKGMKAISENRKNQKKQKKFFFHPLLLERVGQGDMTFVECALA